MKSISIALFAALFATLLSCSNAEDKIEVQETTEAPPAMPTSVPETQSTPVPAANSGVALNPPHGEPGHVCEIPVGQPLDGSGSKNAAAPVEISTEMSVDQSGKPVAKKADAGVKLNPPHGEPGHVCEIPVGQPLK
jgi:hypothetical protein